jgi:hypothetical protein
MPMWIQAHALLGLAFVCFGPANSWADDFDEKAEQLFSKTYHFHAWDETDHTVDGEDWSLPPWVKVAPYSGISINPRKLGPDFPGRIQRSVRTSWREIEEKEGVYDFEPLRQKILEVSDGGRCAVKIGVGASVWETRYFKSLEDRTIVRAPVGTAPRWLERYDIDLIEERPNKSIPFQVVNMDIYSPEYHRRYLRLVEALGRSGIPQMEEVDLCYLHLRSASRGEEGVGPPLDDPRRKSYEERLRAWAAAFRGVEYKLCNVSGKEDDLALCLELGMGQRNGFVEHYLLHAPNPTLGQLLDEDGYLVVDEKNPLVAENRASGDENEEYTKGHVARFGPIETFPHRYRESMLRVLQMRRNFVWAEGGPWLVNPPLLHYVALELGKNAQTAPDAWCYLRESHVPDRANRKWNRAIPVKNFERWVYQRGAEGARAEPTERVDVPQQMFEFAKQHLYDDAARKTSVADGQTEIRFAVAEEFLSGGPHRVAVKITYVDKSQTRWLVEYQTASGKSSRDVICGGTGTTRTVTFILEDVILPGHGYEGVDLRIRAIEGDAVVRFVRVVKLDEPAKNDRQG